jgi:hypothetical protein
VEGKRVEAVEAGVRKSRVEIRSNEQYRYRYSIGRTHTGLCATGTSEIVKQFV